QTSYCTFPLQAYGRHGRRIPPVPESAAPPCCSVNGPIARGRREPKGGTAPWPRAENLLNGLSPVVGAEKFSDSILINLTCLGLENKGGVPTRRSSPSTT